MVSWDLEVQNFPAKIVSRMTPTGTKVRKDFLRVDRYERERLDGEAPDVLFFSDYHIRFGYDFVRGCFWTVIEPYEGERAIDKSKLGELLQNPQETSNSRAEVREQYLKLVTKGKIDNALSTTKNSLGVRYNLLKEKSDPNKVFEAFLFAFKPVTKSIFNHL